MGNKPTVYIIGSAAVIVSGIKLEDWKRTEWDTPEATMLVENDGFPVFWVSCGMCTGCISNGGIEWSSYTTEEGNATATLILDENLEDRIEAVKKVIGPNFEYLPKIEQRILGETDDEYGDTGIRFIVI